MIKKLTEVENLKRQLQEQRDKYLDILERAEKAESNCIKLDEELRLRKRALQHLHNITCGTTNPNILVRSINDIINNNIDLDELDIDSSDERLKRAEKCAKLLERITTFKFYEYYWPADNAKELIKKSLEDWHKCHKNTKCKYWSNICDE